MPERRRFPQTTSLEKSLAKETTQLRKLKAPHRALSATSCFAKPAEPRQLQHMTEWLASGDKHQDKF